MTSMKYAEGGRAKGDGTWVDDNNVVIYVKQNVNMKK